MLRSNMDIIEKAASREPARRVRRMYNGGLRLDDGGDVGGLFGGGTATSARTVSASSGASCTQAGRCWTG